MNIAELAAVVVVSYLIGAIPVGYLMGRFMRGIDIRVPGDWTDCHREYASPIRRLAAGH